ncbi:response regulator [Oleiharenicola lentus]|uniref:response regulator n=1 Tax=Oleiharenicola lentus TaxID=2508720 RepID=UPI003F66D24C
MPPTETSHDWILVIDDDEPIRSMLLIALSTPEVQVVAAGGAAEALEIIKQRPTEPVLVLTDVMMPETNGLVLARKLSAMLKRSKLAIMSGHLNNIAWWPVELREIAYIAKPFRISDLTALVATARAEFKRD